MGKKHIVTSALLYANGPIHIGHIAGAYLPADIYVRFLRLNNPIYHIFQLKLKTLISLFQDLDHIPSPMAL